MINTKPLWQNVHLITILLAAFSLPVLAGTESDAGKAGKADVDELARAAQNPVANLISLPFQNNTNFNFGPRERTQNVMNIQPVLPFQLNDNWNLITRTILPVISQPSFVSGQDRSNGVGDILVTAFFSPISSSKLIWGVGPAVLLPTASNDRMGVGEWGGGVGAVFVTMSGPWVVGSLFSNVWSDTSRDRVKVNQFLWQPFLNYNFGGGWFATTAPIVTSNWEADSGEKWTVPLGGGGGRVFRIGEQNVNMSAQAYYNVETPDNFGPDWTLRLTLQFLFPK